MLHRLLAGDLLFPDAFEVWIAQRVIHGAGIRSNARYISDRAERDLRQYARAAGRFFFGLTLNEIHAGHLLEYQRARALNLVEVEDGQETRVTHPWEHVAGANLIRKEVQTVMRVMRAAGAWDDEKAEQFEPLATVYTDVPRALTPAEQIEWLQAANSRPEWRLAYFWSLVALQTTAATNEMRALRLGDLFLASGTMQIRSEGAKNQTRIRTIPLETPEVVWALGSLIERAKAMGALGPHCYLFPIHITADRYDPLRPMTVWGMRKIWDAVREASGLKWFRVYDLRHTAITRMAEAGVPIPVIMSFAGHISPRMQQHYTAISMESKRRWALAAWAGGAMPFAPGAGRADARPQLRMPVQSAEPESWQQPKTAAFR
jgi:integrase